MKRPVLLDKARYLTSLSQAESYAWISPDKLLVLRPTTVNFCLFPLERAPTQKIPCTAHCLDITTGKETPLVAFNDLHSTEVLVRISISQSYFAEGMETELVYDTDNTKLSPDGQYLMWKSEGSLCMALLDGGEVIRRPYYSNLLPLWYSDSRSWLELSFWGIKRRFLDRNHPPESIFVPGGYPGLALGITKDDCLLLHRFDQMFRRKQYQQEEAKGRVPVDVEFQKIKRGGKIRLPERFTLPLPAPGLIRSVLISPDGKKLAWLIWETAHDLMGTVYSLWTTDLEGKNRRLIGIADESSCEEDEDESEESYPVPHHLQWSPDSRHLSFTYGNEIFMISAQD